MNKFPKSKNYIIKTEILKEFDKVIATDLIILLDILNIILVKNQIFSYDIRCNFGK